MGFSPEISEHVGPKSRKELVLRSLREAPFPAQGHLCPLRQASHPKLTTPWPPFPVRFKVPRFLLLLLVPKVDDLKPSWNISPTWEFPLSVTSWRCLPQAQLVPHCFQTSVRVSPQERIQDSLTTESSREGCSSGNVCSVTAHVSKSAVCPSLPKLTSWLIYGSEEFLYP